jgi:two-component system sensor histidine kinase KdpD
VSASRWTPVAAIVAIGAAAALVGIAAARVDDGSTRALLLVAIAALVLGGLAWMVWLLGGRVDPSDALTERAETASKLSHELKNPLMAIKGLASTGARMFDQMADDERREFFQLIDEEAGRLKRVVEQSATALKVDAERVLYDLGEEDLGALVEEVAWATPHGEHPMSVETEPGIVVRADRKYLGEAIGNLVENAAKFSPPDAPVEVAVRRGEDGEAVVEIADRGPGIPFERTGQVFDRFAAWRPAGYEETPGAGLGLFLARAHVAAHEGRVDVDERDDGGTILRVTLPVEE